MSYDSRAEALRAAKETKAKLKSRGWKIHVFENLGWHWYLLNGVVSLHNNGDGTYWVMISDSLRFAGCGYPPFTPNKIPSFKDPNKAVNFSVRYVEAYLKRLNRVMSKASKLKTGGAV